MTSPAESQSSGPLLAAARTRGGAGFCLLTADAPRGPGPGYKLLDYLHNINIMIIQVPVACPAGLPAPRARPV